MLHELTLKVMAGRDLDTGESEAALEAILSPDYSDASLASFLTALNLKGESPFEVAGFARVMRRHARTIPPTSQSLIDTAGTGGGLETFNISTTAAFVIAGAGVPVAKHGNRAVTSRSGSADLLAALGLNLEAPIEKTEAALREVGISFLFAPHFHPAMKKVAQLRRQLAHRTIFNMLGPLTNPASATLQLIGVYSAELTETIAKALQLLGCHRAWVVHSSDGLDELSSVAPNHVSEVRDDQIRSFTLQPGELGLSSGTGRDYPGGTPAENARVTREILQGSIRGTAREVVLLNAAAAIHLAKDIKLPDALQEAAESVDSGRAYQKMTDMIRIYA